MDKDTVYSLQSYQRQHDNNFHQDIIVLGTKNRIQHLVLHFIKYTANIECNTDREVIQKNLTDFFICILSMANLLNVRLDTYNGAMIGGSFISTIGKMAKACEALDHVEQYPSRDVLTNELWRLYGQILNIAEKNNIDFNKTVLDRWQNIETSICQSNIKFVISKVGRN